MAAMTSFHTETCCHLVSGHPASARRHAAASASSWSVVHSYLLIYFSQITRSHTYVTNYVDQQTLNPDDDYVLPHQCLWTFDVLVCPLSATERFLSQSCCPHSFSIFCCGLKSHLFSLSYPAFWLFSHLYSARAATRHFGHYNRYYVFNI